YAYKFKTKLPAVINAQLSVPAGSIHTDDFKTKLGLQVRVLRSGNFLTTVSAYGIFRRYESDLARFRNFGAEFSAAAGYYKPTWFAAGEFGFDKAITTHIRNGE